MSVVEVTMFRLADAADETAFLAADRAVQAELGPRKGFLRRTTASGGQTDWLVVTLWASTTDADESAETAFEDPDAQALEPLIDATSLAVKRYRSL